MYARRIGWPSAGLGLHSRHVIGGIIGGCARGRFASFVETVMGIIGWYHV